MASRKAMYADSYWKCIDDEREPTHATRSRREEISALNACRRHRALRSATQPLNFKTARVARDAGYLKPLLRCPATALRGSSVEQNRRALCI